MEETRSDDHSRLRTAEAVTTGTVQLDQSLSGTDGASQLFRIRQEYLPAWAGQCAASV